MDEDKKRLIDTYSKLDPVNQAEVIARASLIYTVQENTKKSCYKAMKVLIDCNA